MNSTIKYYEDNAEIFIQNTINADMSGIYKEFLGHIPKNGSILDAGCGSGRDSKYFLEHGFRVDAFDASETMCRAASEYTGIEIKHASFDNYHSNNKYDGIWACASLLHVKYDDMVSVFQKLIAILKPEGVMYCSWKYGESEHTQDDGKYYCDLNENRINHIAQESNLEIVNIWKTSDARVDYNNLWINVLLKKQK